MDALNRMPPYAMQEDKDAVMDRIRLLSRKRDKEKGFEGFTLGEGEAFAYLKNQSGRCAVTANKLTCVPMKLNSFRCVIMPVTMCCRALTLPPQH